jgi:Lipocalin-like domain
VGGLHALRPGAFGDFPDTIRIAEDPGARLFGTWRLISFQLKIVGEEGEPKDIFGPNPIGRIIFSPEHRVVVLYREQIDAPQPMSLALLASMTAYTGKFGLDGDKFITSVDGAWNEIYRGADKFDTLNLSATN